VTTRTEPITRLRSLIAPARQRLEHHPVYREIRDIHHLRTFLQSHVFAVWDFMSLLKSLQANLTCVTTPWVPSPYPRACRLINEIVLGEESDSFGDGFTSHFELYLQAMAEAGADTSAIQTLITQLHAGATLDQALAAAHPPVEALEFLRSTFAFIQSGQPHIVAAAFTFGREDLIPGMFLEMVKDLRQSQENVGLFEYYLDRHVEVDGDSHGPMALQMMEELCGTDETKWEQAAIAAESALKARLALWDGILLRIRNVA
jgi:hypothetical protein